MLGGHLLTDTSGGKENANTKPAFKTSFIFFYEMAKPKSNEFVQSEYQSH